MAIPLSMPNSDEIEESHRLDMLLEQLLITLRQVLIHRRRAAMTTGSRTTRTTPARHRNDNGDRIPVTDDSSVHDPTTRVMAEEERTTASLQLPLPDLVINSPSMKERERRTYGLDGEEEEEEDGGSRSTSWVENGSELIRLAGQLLDQEEVDAKIGGKVKEKEKKKEEERMNVLSLMCPLLGNSVWTTIALLVVWGLLAHVR